MLGALTVVGLLVVLAVVATLLLTRRLVAPMRRLMRAARAVGAGRLDVYVPARSSDELGLLTHTFNHMTQRLAESQAEVGELPAHARGEGRAAHAASSRVATAHAYKLAQHDILTGLPNRSLLNQRLKQILAQAQSRRHACRVPVPRLRSLQAHQRHARPRRRRPAAAGDRAAARRSAVRESRHGGAPRRRRVRRRAAAASPPATATFEMMTVLVARARIVPGAVPARRPDADARPARSASRSIRPTRSDAVDAHQAGRHRDVRGEGSGRNAYRFYTADMNARVQKRLQLETDMRRGWMDDEFFLVYQPQVDMQTGRPRGVEALLRWRDPARGMIPPSEFIPIAEESGMIQALGARVLRDACRQVVRVAPAEHAAAAVGQPVGAAAPARQLARRSSRTRCRPAGCRRTTSTSRSPRA